MKFKTLVSCLLALLLSACAKTTTVRSMVGHESLIQSSQLGIVLPTTSEVKTFGISSVKDCYEYADYISNLLEKRLAIALNERGFRARVLSKSDIKDKEFYRALLNLRQEYDTKLIDLYTKSDTILIKKLLEKLHDPFSTAKVLKINRNIKNATNISVNISQDAKIIGQHTQGDLLIMVNYYHYDTTKAKKLSNMLFWEEENFDDSSTLLIGIVDVDKGRLIWSNAFAINNAFVWSGFKSNKEEMEIEHIDNMVKRVLAAFPFKASNK